MAEREVVLDQPVLMDAQSEALRQATERAEHAEAELAKLQRGVAASHRDHSSATAKHVGSDQDGLPGFSADEGAVDPAGVDAMRKDSMMAHLLDSLDAGMDIGHYGRLVFAMVARHFLPHEQVLTYLCKDKDFSTAQANLMLKQVEGRDYNPPKRERILEWQKEQDFAILPHPDDPDCGNLYRNLKFPEAMYEHIEEYQAQKLEAEE